MPGSRQMHAFGGKHLTAASAARALLVEDRQEI